MLLEQDPESKFPERKILAIKFYNVANISRSTHLLNNWLKVLGP